MSKQQSNPHTEKTATIVVVGGGIVGCTVAALLSQLQSPKPLSIILLDNQPAPAHSDSSAPPGTGDFDLRVVSLSLASEKILRDTGVWSQLEQYRHCAYTAMDIRDHEGTGQLSFGKDMGPSMGTIIENSVLVHALRAFLSRQANVTLHQGISLQTLDNRAGQNILTLAEAGKEHQLLADLVIAADGANSRVRQEAGIGLKQKAYGQKAIVATVLTQNPHRHRARQSFLGTGPLAFLPLADNKGEACYSSIVWSLDEPLADEVMAISDEEFNLRLTRLMQDFYGEVRLCGTRRCFPLIERHSHQYFDKKVVLIGDAAHTIHPLAGQGVNLGLADANCLIKEIERALASGLSIADRSVMRRYQRQRKHKNKEMIVLMQGFKHLFGQPTPGVRLLRNAGLNLIQRNGPLQQWLMQQASGL